MEERYPRKSVLHPGQQLHLHVRRGMTIVVLQGDVLLHTPTLHISEQILRSTLSLREGQAHVFSDRGWISLHARTRAEIACVDSTSQVAYWRGRLLMALFSAMRLRRPAREVLRDS